MEAVGVHVDWNDREIGRILKAQDHHRLAKNANMIEEQIEGVQR